MSTTALAWLGLFGGLALCSLFRPVYAFSLYLLTFFLFPAFWWWGRPLPNLRWNLLAGTVFLLAVLLKAGRKPLQAQPDPAAKRITNVALALLANATFVHVLLAPSIEISLENYLRLLKFVLLFFLIVASIRRHSDLRLVLWSIIIGAAYIGYEVTVNDRGRFIKGRLEGVGAAGVDDANQLASLMATVLTLAGGLFFWGKRWDKLLVAVTGPLILNVILLCSSRGAFLALIVGAVSFLVTAPGRVRRKAVFGLGLAGLATFLLLGDPQIVARFATTFTSAEERDSSAAGRLVLWKAGFTMLRDNPLGAGGDAFRLGYGGRYLQGVGVDRQGRSVHNGILNEACEWGLQGIVLRILFIGLAVLVARKTVRQQTALGRSGEAALGCCLIASAVAFVVSSAFGDYMDEEWGYWVPALMTAYARVYRADALAGTGWNPAPVLAAPPVVLSRPLSPSSDVQPSL
jgi:O-antigen ligase